jgi:TonB family protein
MKILNLILLLVSINFYSQERIETNVDVMAHAVGGQTDVDYIFATQVLYPPTLLKKGVSEDVTVYFTVTATGVVKDIDFKQAFREEFKTEVQRLLRFINFEPAKIGNVNVTSQIFLTFKFSPDSYRKFCKQRGFIIPKDIKNYDTSFVVYDRADESPEYSSGEDALNQYILDNLEYPDLAIRQGLQGTVVLGFIVEANGTLSNILVQKEFNHLCTNEAIKTLRNTKWKSGKKDGKNIRYITKYPIVFNLKNINKDNATSEQR